MKKIELIRKSWIDNTGYENPGVGIKVDGTFCYFIPVPEDETLVMFLTSDININTPGGQNLDGIEISLLADRLQEF
jgi:hypothetical protein